MKENKNTVINSQACSVRNDSEGSVRSSRIKSDTSSMTKQRMKLEAAKVKLEFANQQAEMQRKCAKLERKN